MVTLLTLRYELQFNLAFQELVRELFVLADVGSQHAFDLLVLQQQSDTEIVQTHIVRDAGQLLAALSLER